MWLKRLEQSGDEESVQEVVLVETLAQKVDGRSRSPAVETFIANRGKRRHSSRCTVPGNSCKRSENRSKVRRLNGILVHLIRPVCIQELWFINVHKFIELAMLNFHLKNDTSKIWEHTLGDEFFFVLVLLHSYSNWCYCIAIMSSNIVSIICEHMSRVANKSRISGDSCGWIGSNIFQKQHESEVSNNRVLREGGGSRRLTIISDFECQIAAWSRNTWRVSEVSPRI